MQKAVSAETKGYKITVIPSKYLVILERKRGKIYEFDLKKWYDEKLALIRRYFDIKHFDITADNDNFVEILEDFFRELHKAFDKSEQIEYLAKQIISTLKKEDK